MEELFGGVGSGFRVSMKDSIMMDILHSAMNKAHEKMKCKEGVMERLIEISKFYELAVMELEGCLRIVKEETDSFALESKHEEVLSDLLIIKDRLQGRLQETELTIMNKDRELIEKVENESILKQALELKEIELASFRDSFGLRKTKSDELSNRACGDEAREGEICELKNSVEQKVWSFKQKFLDGQMSLTSEMRKLDPDYEMVDEEKYLSPDNKKIEQMSLDIDNLKETLDLAFETMQNAILLSEVEPIEQQWRWTIEKDTVSIVTEGFVRNSRERFEPKERKHKKIVGFLAEHWSDLMNEITSLRHALEPVGCQNDVQVKSVKSCDHGKSDHISMKVEKLDQTEEHLGEDKKGDESRYVAKMIKNHESIIRQKSEEMKWLWLKGELLQEKGCSSLRRDSDYNGLKERIQKVIVTLDNLINWNAELAESDYRGSDKGIFPEKSLSKSDFTTDKEKIGVDSSAGFSEKVDNISDFHSKDVKLHDEIRKMNQDIEDSNLISVILEETYFVMFRGLMEDFSIKLYNLTTDNIVREEIFWLVFDETVKTANFALSEYQEALVPENVPHDVPSTSEVASLVREDVYMTFFEEMVKEWKMEVNAYDTENIVREDIYRFVIIEAMKDAYVVLNDSESQHDGDFAEDVLLDNKILEVSGEESLIQKLDSLLECCEEEELDKWVISEEFSTEEESNFDSISSKLEKVLQQLSTSKTLLGELGSSSASTVSDLDKVRDQMTRPRDFVSDEENSFCQPKKNKEGKLNQTTLTVSSPLMGFPQVFADFECTVHEKLGLNMSRLQELKHHHDQLSELVVSVKEKEMLYKKAFLRKCHNLQKAETEVDLLGDQVDVLIGLLEKIYVTLHHYSPVLQQYVGVSDILRLIKKELIAGSAQVTD